MAKTAELKQRRLKTYKAVFGFHESVVAAPNQTAALKAWGVRQNLFAEGQAEVSDDPQAIEASQAHPEVPLRRVAGTSGPFVLEPGPPPAPAASKRSKASRPARPPADRSALDAAEARLTALEHDRHRIDQDFRRRQEALDVEREEALQSWTDQRAEAEAAIKRERKAYRDAGGSG